MDEQAKKWLEGTELILASDKYSLYVNKEAGTIHLYNSEDVWEISLNALGNLGFNTPKLNRM